jgi:hypothetical protein
MHMTKEQAIKFIKDLMPFTYIDLPEDQAKVIRDRITTEKLEPIDHGLSLHCWSTDYMVDGQRYQLIGELGKHDDPMVCLVKRTFVD